MKGNRHIKVPPTYPHVTASWINNIWDEGTKEEACRYLQVTWNELCAVKKELEMLQNRVEEDLYTRA